MISGREEGLLAVREYDVGVARTQDGSTVSSSSSKGSGASSTSLTMDSLMSMSLKRVDFAGAPSKFEAAAPGPTVREARASQARQLFESVL